MYHKKQGLPEENEIIICTVKKILPHSIFVDLDEYENKEGLIHISEISPGRVRNIRDFVKEGKKIVCKVLKLDRERGHLDLSLRRVNQVQRINKNKEYKQEIKAEKILEMVGKELNLSIADMYGKVGKELIKNYDSLYIAFEKIAENEKVLDEIKIEKKISDSLLKYVKDKVKKREVRITATMTITSQLPNGIEEIKNVIKGLEEKSKNITIKYMGAPKYHLALTADDYKTAEKEILKIKELGLVLMKNKGNFE